MSYIAMYVVPLELGRRFTKTQRMYLSNSKRPYLQVVLKQQP